MIFRLFCVVLFVASVSCVETPPKKEKEEKVPWLPQSFPHLKHDLVKCSRVAGRSLASANGFPALVCDPDQVLTNEEALSLESELREVLAIPVNFECPCSTMNDLNHAGAPTFRRVCPPDTGDDSFMIAVAVMRKMSSSHIREHGREENADSRLRAARAFAEQLKKKWFKGVTRCGEVFVVLYSAEDNILYVSTGQAANQRVPNDKLKSMLIKVRPMFPGDPSAGIRHLINRLKSELKEEYARV